MALVAGSERGKTLEDNIDAFSELGLRAARRRPRVRARPDDDGDGPGARAAGDDLADRRAGGAPRRRGRDRPGGRGARHRDGAVSSFASKPVEEVVAANPKTFFQLYWSGTREQILARVERAQAAGAVGIILTLDWSFSQGRDWGSPSIPQQIDLRTMVRFAPEVARRPAWALRWLRSGALPDLTAPNMALPGQPAPGFFAAYGEWMQTPLPTWEDLRWLRSQYDRPAHAQGRHARRRRAPGRRHRLRRDLGVQPRRQQPRRHAGVGAGAAGRRRGGRLAGRRAARRRHPPRQRRRQGGRARRQGRHDRAGLPVGPRRQRPGRGRERPRHPAQRHRLRAARHRQVAGARPDPRRPARARRLRAPARGGRAGRRGTPRPGHHGAPSSGGARSPTSPGRRRRSARGAVLVVPLGATEQHGPHLPVSTDTDVAVALAAPGRRRGRTSSSRLRCRTARAASTRASRARCRSASEALELLLVELVRSASASFRRVLLLSAHGGNAATVRPRRAAAAGRAARRPRLVAALAGRRARRPDRDLGAARARPAGCSPTGRRPVRRRRWPTCCPRCGAAACAGSARTACWATRPARARTQGEALLCAAAADLGRLLDGWPR